MEKQTCPRRMNEWGPWDREPGLDEWRIEPNGDRTCSFCGSLHPADFEKVLEQAIADETTRIEQSDKSYKVYIHREGITNASEGAIKYYKQHNYPDQVDIDRIAPKFVAAIGASRPKWERLLNQLAPKVTDEPAQPS